MKILVIALISLFILNWGYTETEKISQDEFMLNKELYYSKTNKGIFSCGYYFPNIEGALAILNKCWFSKLVIAEGEYKIYRLCTLKGNFNILMGEGEEHKAILINCTGEEFMIDIQGYNFTIGHFTLDAE